MKKKILNILYLFILLQPIIDIITSLMTKFLDFRITLGLVVRGLLFVFSIIYILFISKSKYKKASTIYLSILLVFALLYFVTKPSMFVSKTFIISEIIYMFKYFYTLVMLLSLFNIFDDFKPNNRRIFKLLQIELFIYCFTIVLANVTGTAFATYSYGAGNSGWFYAGNEIGIIIALLFPLVFLLINKAQTFYILLYVIPIILAIQIIGTKTSMLGLILPTILFFLYYLIRIRKGKFKQFVMVTIMLTIIIVPTQDLPVIKNMKNSVESLERREAIPENKKDKDYTDDKVTKLVFSDRDYVNKKIKRIYTNSNITSKLFGIGFTKRQEFDSKIIEKTIELDYHDIFYRYGIIGFLIYISPFVLITLSAVKLCIKKRFRLNIKQLLLGYISYVGLGIAAIVGHTLGAPAVSFYVVIALVLLMYYLKNDQYKIKHDNKKISILVNDLDNSEIVKTLNELNSMYKENYNIEVISTYKINNNKLEITNLKELRQINYNNIKNKNIIIKYYNKLIDYVKCMIYVEDSNSKYMISFDPFYNYIVSNNKNRDTIAIAIENNNMSDKIIKKLVFSCNNTDYLIVNNNEIISYLRTKLHSTKYITLNNNEKITNVWNQILH